MTDAPAHPVAPRRVHSDAALLDGARLVFARDGFEAASMEAIAAAAGSTKPTLYARFGSKRELYERAVQRDADALLAHLFAAYSAVAGERVSVMVDASIRAYFEFFAAHPGAFALLFASGRSEPAVNLADHVLDAITDRLTTMVEAVLGRTGRRAPASSRMIAAMLLGIAHHGVDAIRRDPELDAERAPALATAMALGALRALPRELVR